MSVGHPGAAPGSPAAALRAAIHREVGRVVVGQGHLVDGILTAMGVGGHLLLEGPPGVAKSLLATVFATACGLDTDGSSSPPTCSPRT